MLTGLSAHLGLVSAVVVNPEIIQHSVAFDFN